MKRIALLASLLLSSAAACGGSSKPMAAAPAPDTERAMESPDGATTPEGGAPDEDGDGKPKPDAEDPCGGGE